MTVEEYLKQDRQWTHEMRVGHAKFQLSRAKSDESRKFWRAVLKANNKEAYIRREW